MQSILAPFQTANENPEQLDISVVVKGGGVTGQTSAVQLGVARALLKMNPDLRAAMRKSGFLTPRCTHQRAQETRSEARPQGSDLHEALILSSNNERSAYFGLRENVPGAHPEYAL